MSVHLRQGEPKVVPPTSRGAREKLLNVREIAATIFDIEQPTEKQVNHIRVLLAKKVLRPSVTDPWKTTASEVARYLASHDIDVKAARMADDDKRSMAREYQQLAIDYFLAVALRRKGTTNGQSFERAVVFGQVAALVAIVCLAFFTVTNVVNHLQPYHKEVSRYLAAHHQRFEIREITSFTENDESPGESLRVRYRYFSNSGRGIETERLLNVAQGRIVTEVQEED